MITDRGDVRNLCKQRGILQAWKDSGLIIDRGAARNSSGLDDDFFVEVGGCHGKAGILPAGLFYRQFDVFHL